MEKNQIKVSVIIPFYNDEKYLEESIKSIVNQTLEDIELILIDDGSLDNSTKIAKRYEKKYSNVIYIRQYNQGQGIARNKGIEIAKGKYIYFLDSDDYLDKNALELCYKLATRNKADVITFNSRMDKIDSSKFIIDYSKRNFLDDSIYGLDYFKISLKNNKLFIPVWLYLYRSDFLREISIKFEPIIFEDKVFTIQICMENPKIIYLNKAIHCRRIRESSTMTKCKTINHLEGSYINIIKSIEIYNELNKNDKEMKNMVLQLIRRNINIFIDICRSINDSNEKYILKKEVENILISSLNVFSLKQLIKLKIA